MTDPSAAEPPADHRARILAVAAELVARGGAEAATTRALASAAGVQAPVIYRLFGDKRGLLDAVAEATLADYVAAKAERARDADPVADLVQGWDDYLAFGLSHPAVFALMHGGGPGTPSPAAATGLEVLRERVRRVARDGRLRVSEERAADLIHAVATGVISTLLAKAAAERGTLADAAREAVTAAILATPASPRPTGPAATATALRASLGEVTSLSPGERLLLDELLRRIGDEGAAGRGA